MDALAYLLQSPPPDEPIASLEAWFDRLIACPYDRPIDRAFWAGFEADRLGYAFVGGYLAAIDRLIEAPRSPARVCLAATEAGGAHPRAIETRLETTPRGELRLRGEKTFATLASASDELLVVASQGTTPDGKNQLKLVRVRAKTRGITIEERAPTPFAPEIPHARVKLVDVAVREEDVFPGDGYAAYLKPFRTFEDTHVLAATLGHLLRIARANRFELAVPEGCFALSMALRHVGLMDVADPAAHVALAGVFSAAVRLLTQHDSEWTKTDSDTRDRWRRDVPLLSVAEAARQKRTEAAWKAIGYAASR